MGFLSSFAFLIFEFVIATASLVLILGYLPTPTVFPNFPIEPVAYETPNFTTHADKWNNVLGQNSQRILSNEIGGPESIAIRDHLLYTGLADGRLVEINLFDGKVRTVTRFAPDDTQGCDDDVYFRLERCGRPLGLRFDDRGYLTVVDAFFGLWRLNATTGHKKPLGLQPGDKNLPAEWRGLFNDFAFDPNDQNLLYVSVSSTKWGLDRTPWSLNEHENTGLVLAVDLKTGKVTKLLDGFYFTNGLEISIDKKYLLIAECTKYRISKLNLDEIRKAVTSGKTSGLKRETFADILVGEPDNIRLHGDNIYVGVAIARALGPSPSDLVAQVPLIRKAVARLIYLTSLVLDFVHESLWKHVALEEVVFKLKSGHIFYHGLPHASAIVVLDARTGATKAVLGSEEFNAVSEAVVHEVTGDLFFGSFKNRFLGKLPSKYLKEALAN